MNHDNDNDNGLRFLSVCSGIEAASVAWGPLGWKAVAFGEIDKAASAVLAHHYPDVPNLGDFTTIDVNTIGRVDILCGGTPCQAFSIAGARMSLDDARGNLSLAFVGLAHELADNNGLRNVVWENVLGVLSTKDNAFGCFLAGLVGADGPFVPVERQPAAGRSTRWWRWSEKDKCHAVCWPGYGMVTGPKGRAAWAVKDAQFFGLAQRRERVLVVADFGNGADPSAVLFERVSVPWNPPARGEKREDVAGTIAPSLTASGERRDDRNSVYAASSIGGYRDAEVSGPVRAAGGDNGGGSENLAVAYAPEIARCDATREGSSQDYESTTMVAQVYSMMPQNSGKDFKARPVDVAQPLMASGPSHGNQGGDVVCVTVPVTHTLTTEGADASEDGTGRGTPIIAFDTTQITSKANRSNPKSGDPCHPLAAGAHAPAIAFSNRGIDSGETTETLRAASHGALPMVAQTVALRGREGGATAEMGGEVATALRASSGGGDKPHVLAFHERQGGQVDEAPVHGPLTTGGGKPGQSYPAVRIDSAVRRLTPRECERLQGFPDDYTRIPVKWYATKKVTKNRPEDMWEADINGGWWLMAADGPRYKQLGNSWAVPKFRWLGERIQRLMPANDNTQAARDAA